ncbi:MAG: hypothetical protein ACC650_08640, partial [Gammaproteobacteria bacterium]
EVTNGFNPLLIGEELLDGDNDGLTNLAEQAAGTDPLLADTDSDGLNDGDEVNTYLTNPLSNDTDGDGLTDGDEVNTYLTNPLSNDTDGDGLTDGDEVNIYMTDPLFANLPGDLAPRGAPDGKLNTADVLIMYQLVLGQIIPNAGEMLLADLNQDNEVNAGDLILSIRMALGLMPMP